MDTSAANAVVGVEDDQQSVFSKAATLIPEPVNDASGNDNTGSTQRAPNLTHVVRCTGFSFTGHNNNDTDPASQRTFKPDLHPTVYRHFTSYRNRKKPEDPCPCLSTGQRSCTLRGELAAELDEQTDLTQAFKYAILGWCMNRSGMKRESRIPFMPDHLPKPWIDTEATITGETVLPGPIMSQSLHRD